MIYSNREQREKAVFQGMGNFRKDCRVVFMFLLVSLFFLSPGAWNAVYAQQAGGITTGARQAEQPEGQGDFEDFEGFGEFDTGKDSGRGEVFDPLSGYNRFMTRVNDKFYFWVLKPAATGYAKVTPGGVRRSVGRFFKNLGYPVRFVNNLLQLKVRRAGVETARFLVNTTVGVAGFSDPAEAWMDLEAYPEDFGQTLGVYGVGSGFHLVLPLMGPSNLRDALGKVPDLFLDPVYYVEPSELAIGISAYDRLNYTSLHLGEYADLKKDAVDWYVFLRSAYEQNRRKKIAE